MPGLRYVYMANPVLSACVDAIRDCGRAGAVRVLCHDTGAEIRGYLKDGSVDFTIDQDLFYQTYQSLKLLYRLTAEYKKPEKRLYYSRNSILNAETV
jgi:ABC-type sugar transport system substrate-binding protein